MLIILMMDAHGIAIHERNNVAIEYNIRRSNITIQIHKLKLLFSTASIGKWYPSATDHSDPPWLLDNLRQVQPREMGDVKWGRTFGASWHRVPPTKKY